MTSQPIHFEDFENTLSSTKGELLELLLQSDEDVYPWNPAEPEAEAYFAELERSFALSDWQTEEETTCASQSLFNQLHHCWDSPLSSAIDKLRASLSERFTRVPEVWLEAISNTAQQVFSPNLSLADQLVLCVKPLFPDWAEDDLFVLSRPLAHPMRDSKKREESSGVVGATEWTELSPMEQVRLSLAIAHSALVELKSSTNIPEGS